METLKDVIKLQLDEKTIKCLKLQDDYLKSLTKLIKEEHSPIISVSLINTLTLNYLTKMNELKGKSVWNE